MSKHSLCSDLLTPVTQCRHAGLGGSSLSSGSEAPHRTTGSRQGSRKAERREERRVCHVCCPVSAAACSRFPGAAPRSPSNPLPSPNGRSEVTAPAPAPASQQSAPGGQASAGRRTEHPRGGSDPHLPTVHADPRRQHHSTARLTGEEHDLGSTSATPGSEEVKGQDAATGGHGQRGDVPPPPACAPESARAARGLVPV